MELARVFLPDDGFEIISYNGSTIAHLLGENSFFINEAGSSDRDEIKREMYKLLCGLTGKRPPWGTLTGVRPLKPALALCGDHSVSEMENIIRDKYLMSRDKSSLIADIADYQLSQGLGDPSSRYSIYVGIPFCPTRCAYCSFASNVASKEAHVRYLTDLLKEIGYREMMADQADRAMTIAVNGMLPNNSLGRAQLKRLRTYKGAEHKQTAQKPVAYEL